VAAEHGLVEDAMDIHRAGTTLIVAVACHTEAMDNRNKKEARCPDQDSHHLIRNLDDEMGPLVCGQGANTAAHIVRSDLLHGVETDSVGVH